MLTKKDRLKICKYLLEVFFKSPEDATGTIVCDLCGEKLSSHIASFGQTYYARCKDTKEDLFQNKDIEKLYKSCPKMFASQKTFERFYNNFLAKRT